MATIYNAKLARQGISGGISRITVTYNVAFSGSEQSMKPYWTEKIELWGDDWAVDDYLYRAPYSGFPTGDDPTRSRRRVFDLATDLLDEDWGRDEVYAKIKITPRMPTSDTGKTNTITGYF